MSISTKRVLHIAASLPKGDRIRRELLSMLKSADVDTHTDPDGHLIERAGQAALREIAQMFGGKSNGGGWEQGKGMDTDLTLALLQPLLRKTQKMSILPLYIP